MGSPFGNEGYGIKTKPCVFSILFWPILALKNQDSLKNHGFYDVLWIKEKL